MVVTGDGTLVISLDESLLTSLGVPLLLVAIAVSWLVIVRFSERDNWLEPLRERLVFGIPWGTIVVIAGVYCVYYLIQGGGRDGGPIVVAFRSWSLWYPQGLVFSSFSHASESHLTSNLLATLAFAPIVEYAWAHYPSQASEADSRSNHTVLRRPAGRIALFVVAVLCVGVMGSLFVPGAIIGFSGVVFAFAGFALVVRPLLTIGAILGLEVVRLLRAALTTPVATATARPRFVSPSWADVAIHGHLFGLLVGVLLAVLLLQYRDERPEILYIWFAALVFAVTRSMYAVYWYLGADQFVLYRALGTAGVFLLASLVGLATVYGSTIDTRRLRVSIHVAAVAILVSLVCMIAIGGLAYNLTNVAPGPDVEDGMEVGDYTVAYVDTVEDQYISSVSFPFIDELSVSVSGVVVASDDRNAWELSRSENRLEFDGEAAIPVGDATWREVVYVNRTTWQVQGGNSTFKVYGSHRATSEAGASRTGDRKLLFADEPAVAGVQLNGTTVSVAPTEDFYEIVVERNDTRLGTERIPRDGEEVTIASITFERDGPELYARHGRTELQIAEFSLRGRPD